MTNRFEIEGRQHDVTFVAWDEASSAEESQSTIVGVRRMDAQTVWLRIGERRERVVVARGEGGAWVWHAGRARWVEDSSGPPQRRRKTTGLPGAVTPPMPATVVRILVQVGDQVGLGQGLVVVSAMKMETTLCAPHEGVVQSINAQVGATVRPGEILVDVQKLGGDAG